jgi:ketosteroid isomerase-like protein
MERTADTGKQGDRMASSMLMTYESMMFFAETWIDSWNRRDVEAVLSHFADHAQFVSPFARNFAGHPALRNKNELEQYWRAALDRINALEFKLDHASWVNGECKRACEIMQFDGLGRQIKGEALYGALVWSEDPATP